MWNLMELISADPEVTVPEPATCALLGSGVLGLLILRRKRA